MKLNFRTSVFLAALCLLAVTFWFAYQLWLAIATDGQVQPLERYKMTIELYKSLIAGIVVVLLGTIIPLVFKLSREDFEHNREARRAYSEAKTGVDYLHIRLCTLSLEQAAQHIQTIHVNKHLAETYPELTNYLYRKTVSEWGSEMWSRLNATRIVLEENSKDWDQMPFDQRLSKLKYHESIPAPKKSDA